MFKIHYPTQDELVVASIPFLAYAGTAVLLVTGGCLAVFAPPLVTAAKPVGLVLIAGALWFACLGIHRKELVVKRNLQVMYYI
ncbi:MAG: hypothetical protein IRZ29_05745, partial [Thermoflavifilum sp.]|nr:hypothetical protein [Thermoflavifilum sp.]